METGKSINEGYWKTTLSKIYECGIITRKTDVLESKSSLRKNEDSFPRHFDLEPTIHGYKKYIYLGVEAEIQISEPDNSSYLPPQHYDKFIDNTASVLIFSGDVYGENTPLSCRASFFEHDNKRKFELCIMLPAHLYCEWELQILRYKTLPVSTVYLNGHYSGSSNSFEIGVFNLQISDLIFDYKVEFAQEDKKIRSA